MMKLTALLISIALCGCILIEFKAEPSEIVDYARKKQSEGANQNLLWYRGRKAEYDYFKYVHGMAAERRFKVNAGAIVVPKKFDLTDDSSQWVSVPSIGNEWDFNVYSR